MDNMISNFEIVDVFERCIRRRDHLGECEPPNNFDPIEFENRCVRRMKVAEALELVPPKTRVDRYDIT